MSDDWVLRWLAMLALFALSSLALSMYAGASQPAPTSLEAPLSHHPP